MKEVDVKIIVTNRQGVPTEMLGRVGLPSTSSDALRDLVEGFVDELVNVGQWEAFFYNVGEDEGYLLAYISDAGEHEVFHDPSVLKLQ